MERITALLLVFFMGIGIHATSLPIVVETWLADYTDNEEQAETIYQVLMDKLAHPINLNTVNRETLEQFAFLSELQIENLLEYRHDRDFFATPYELSLIEGFDENTLSLLMPFVVALPLEEKQAFSFRTCFKNASQQINTRFDYTFQHKLANVNPLYLGKPWAGYINYQLNHDQFSISATMEKDALEPFTLPYNAGFDFYGGHMAWKNIGIVKDIIIGDYTPQFGQGLVMGSGGSFGNWANLSSMIKRQDKISGKKKGSETYFLRGAALSLQSKHWTFTALGSIKYTDLAAGLHRTLNELAKKKSGYNWLVGGNIMARYTHFKIGTTAMYDSFTQTAFMGLDYRTYFKNFQFSGEIAVNHQGKIASLQNIQVQLHSSLLYAIQARYYSKNYNNALGYNSIESSYKNGEAGVFMGLEWQITPTIKLNTCADVYQSLSQAYRISKPAIHYKTFASITLTPKQNQQVLAKWQWNLSERNAANSNDGILPTYPYTKNKVQITYQGNFTNGLILKSGWVAHFFQYHTDELCSGHLVYQDIGWQNHTLNIVARLAFFDVPDYDNKITVYENDVLYAFSNTAFYRKGIKTYLNIGYKPYKGWGIFLKIAHTWYWNQNSIGTGNEAINGPSQTYFHCLVQYKW